VTLLPLLTLQVKLAWVWADLHLRDDQPDEIQAFAKQLRAVPAEVDSVIVLGDLFDAWIGPETWQNSAFQPLLKSFGTLARQQTRLILVRGNRDVLLNPKDAVGLPAEVVDRILLTAELGDKILLSHGDEYCLNDQPYQRLRRTLRRPWVRFILRSLPFSLRNRIAARMRGHSQRAVGRKPLDVLALSPDAAQIALSKVGAGRAVIGHLHVASEQNLASGGVLQVLPAWAPGVPAWRFEN